MDEYEESISDEPARPHPHPHPLPPALPRIRTGRLWAGGIGTAAVMALLVVVSILLVRGVFHIPVLAPARDGAYGTANTTSYALGAAIVALLATALLELLLEAMPNPLTFFYWITGLVTAAAVILPFTVTADQNAQYATAAINLVAGIAMISTLGSIAPGSVRSTSPWTPGADTVEDGADSEIDRRMFR